jgi:homoserine O-succinyltransferase
MPVWLDSGPAGCRLFTTNPAARPSAQLSFPDDPRKRIEIGLLNNMADSALEQTERQVLKLLHAASADLAIRLRLFALPGVQRAEWGQKHLSRLHYLNSDALWNSDLDGFIVTGAEPRTSDLKKEAYWYELADAFEWADDNTISTVTSCLAVHAAVLHFDGIDRCSLSEKCFGIFEFERISDHPLAEAIPRQFRMPHSRWNAIEERALRASGYEILATSPVGGVDTFIKPKRSLFVFFQGHPEYEAWTLFGEYRRDVGRFLNRERTAYPAMPSAYFDDDSAAIIRAFRDRAIAAPQKGMMAEFPTERLVGKLSDPWRPTAVQTYSNWLRWIAARKAEKSMPLPVSSLTAALNARTASKERR